MRKFVPVVIVGALALAGCGSVSSGSSRSTTQARLATAEPAATVVAVGDIACPPSGRVTRKTCRQARTAKAAVALAPDAVVALGDEQYEKGRYRGFTHSYAKSWGQLLSVTWPVPGNHEYYTTGASGYYRYFAGRQPGSPGYYRQTLAGWQLYLLNSNCDRIDCRAERAWLRQEMDSHPSDCSLIAFHHPRFSSGGEHGSSLKMRRFWKIAYARGVDVALAGHDHDQERFAPMTPDGVVDQAHGITEFVSGGGGRSLYAKGRTVPGSQFFKSRFGLLELTLSPGSYAWRFLSPGLRVRDSGSAACR
jgi:hypothetical protein